MENSAPKKWQLTESSFEKLLAAFDEDPETAGEMYLLLTSNLVRYFEVRGIRHARTAAEDVLNRIARKLEQGEQFENVNTYAIGVARLVTLEYRKSPEQKTSNEIPDIGVSATELEDAETDTKLKCLEKCLAELSADKREIIVGYYRGERRKKIENRNRIAEKLGIPQNALRNRAVRIRNRLEKCIRRCVSIGG